MTTTLAGNFTPVAIGANTKELTELGLRIDSATGQIYGTSVQSIEDGGVLMYRTTETNTYGSVSTDIQLDIENRAIDGLEYYGSDDNFNSSAQAPQDNNKYRPIFEEGDVIINTDILHESDYNPFDLGNSGGFIETYIDISNAGYMLTNYGLTLNTITTGDITGTINQSANFEREGDLHYIRGLVNANPTVIQGSSLAINSGAAITSSDDGNIFVITVKEKKLIISYKDSGYGDNVILVQGDARQNGIESGADSEYFNVTNDGGLVALTQSGGASNSCTVEFVSSKEGNADNLDLYSIDRVFSNFYGEDDASGMNGDKNNTCNGICNTDDALVAGADSNSFQFEGSNCSFRYLKNNCFSRVVKLEIPWSMILKPETLGPGKQMK